MALEILVGCVESLLPTSIKEVQLLSRGVQQDDDCLDERSYGASPILRRASTFTSRVVRENESSEGLAKGDSTYSQSRDSTASACSGISDDLQGLLIPGRNVVLRFESMSAAELKVRLTVLVLPRVKSIISHHGQYKCRACSAMLPGVATAPAVLVPGMPYLGLAMWIVPPLSHGLSCQ